jgi:CRISPR-associated endonuclease Cas1
MAKKRNVNVTSTCMVCSASFHPWTGAEQTQLLCSLSCACKHGFAVRKARSAGASTTPVQQGTRTTQRIDPPQASPPQDLLVQASADWLAAGQHYEQLVARLTASPPNAARHGKRLTSGRTLILAGHGAGLKVERDSLMVSEGHTHYPQTPLVHTLSRGIHDVTRIVCLNPTGALSFAAIQWCAQQEISVLLLDRDGSILSAFTPDAQSDATLRRAQYLAASTGRDVEIARELVRRKIAGQRETLLAHPHLPDAERATGVLADALTWLELPTPPEWLTSINSLRVYEGRCAAAYFGAWQGMSLRWATADRRRISPHWLSVRARSSSLSHEAAARHAVDPANAILNYAYAVLEGQTRQALAAAGFDLACEFLHADRRGRDALVYDLMELGRPPIDDHVLTFLQATTFHSGDYTRVSDGSCRLHPQLARAVVAACGVPQQRLTEHAAWLATYLRC